MNKDHREYQDTLYFQRFGRLVSPNQEELSEARQAELRIPGNAMLTHIGWNPSTNESILLGWPHFLKDLAEELRPTVRGQFSPVSASQVVFQTRIFLYNAEGRPVPRPNALQDHDMICKHAEIQYISHWDAKRWKDIKVEAGGILTKSRALRTPAVFRKTFPEESGL